MYKRQLQHSWPSLAAEQLSWSYTNDSWPGGSNDRIVRTTLSWLCAAGTSDVFVVIGWTEPSRREIYVPDRDRYLHLGNLEQNIRRLQVDLGLSKAEASEQANALMVYGWHEVESYTRYYSQVLLLSSFLRSRKIPFLFFNALDDCHAAINLVPDQSRYHSDVVALRNAIDWRDFLQYDHSVDSVFFRFSKCLAGVQLDGSNHPTQLAHQQFANLIKDRMLQRLNADADHVV